jgi:hypothetical protein
MSDRIRNGSLRSIFSANLGGILYIPLRLFPTFADETAEEKPRSSQRNRRAGCKPEHYLI